MGHPVVRWYPLWVESIRRDFQVGLGGSGRQSCTRLVSWPFMFKRYKPTGIPLLAVWIPPRG